MLLGLRERGGSLMEQVERVVAPADGLVGDGEKALLRLVGPRDLDGAIGALGGERSFEGRDAFVRDFGIGLGALVRESDGVLS